MDELIQRLKAQAEEFLKYRPVDNRPKLPRFTRDQVEVLHASGLNLARHLPDEYLAHLHSRQFHSLDTERNKYIEQFGRPVGEGLAKDVGVSGEWYAVIRRLNNIKVGDPRFVFRLVSPETYRRLVDRRNDRRVRRSFNQ